MFITVHRRFQKGLQRGMACKKLVLDEDEANDCENINCDSDMRFQKR